MGDFWVQDGETLLFIGDSITDCGRRGPDGPLGVGYVRLFTELVTARFPERRIRYINTGIGGNRITDLKGRWQEDMLAHRPDRLSIKIGINDLHSHLRDPDHGVGPELFEEIYDELLDLTHRELGCPVVLLTPFYISTDRSGTTFESEVLSLITRYIETARKMSERYGTRLVDLHEVFQRQLEYREPDVFCPEPVHPNRAGHMVIANAVVEGMMEG